MSQQKMYRKIHIIWLIMILFENRPIKKDSYWDKIKTNYT